MKIKATNPNIKAMKLIVPVDGIIEVDAKGEANVSEKAAAALVNGTNDWEYVGELKTTQEEENVVKDEEPTVEEPGAVEAPVEAAVEAPVETPEQPIEEPKEVQSEDEEVIAGIKAMPLDAMIAMAREANYPESEWARFSKKEKLMSAYLIKKYNEGTK